MSTVLVVTHGPRALFLPSLILHVAVPAMAPSPDQVKLRSAFPGGALRAPPRVAETGGRSCLGGACVLVAGMYNLPDRILLPAFPQGRALMIGPE